MRSEVKKKYAVRVDEILRKVNQIRKDNPVILQECLPATIAVFERIYGRSSLQLEQLLGTVKQLGNINPSPGVVDERIRVVLRGVLVNLKSELESGLIGKIFDQAANSAMADFIILSEKGLSDGQKDVSAVLASTALEEQGWKGLHKGKESICIDRRRDHW